MILFKYINMAKKNFNSPAMDNLLAGLTGGDQQESSAENISPTEEATETSAKSTKRQKKPKKEVTSATIDVDIMDKVRALADKRDLSVSVITSIALKRFIIAYEGKYGELRPKKAKKKELKENDIDDLLDL